MTRARSSCLRCEFCLTVFQYKKQLLNHQEKLHNKELPYACAKCQRAFASAWDLNDHVMNHKEVVIERSLKPVDPRPPCKPSYKVKDLVSQLRVLKLVLEKLPEENVRKRSKSGLKLGCKSGPKSVFKRDKKRRGRVRLNVRDNKRTFTCTQCERRFDRAIQLKSHMLIHTYMKNKKQAENNDSSIVDVYPTTLNEPSSPTRPALTRSTLKLHNTSHSTNTQLKRGTLSDMSDTTIVSYGAPSIDDSHDTESDPDIKNTPPKDHQQLNSKTLTPVETNTLHVFKNGKPKKGKVKPVVKRSYKFKNSARKAARVNEDKMRAFACVICEKRFRKQRQLDTHTMSHTEKKVYPCSQCEQVFHKSAHYTTHFAETHCGGGVVTEDGVISYACPVCSKSFNKMYYLNRHVKRSHTEAGVCLCTQCGKKFSTPHNLRSHEVVHTGSLPFACEQCGRRYSQAATMNRHIRRDHTVERPYACEQCDKSFVLAFDLRVHMGCHEKTHECEQCGRKFGLRVQLKRHEVTHTDEKPFVCKKCGKRFALAWYRTAHMKVMHCNDSKITGERIYDCSQCEEKFDKFWDLNRHVRTSHSDALPHICSHCSRRFVSKRRLKLHEAGHTGKLKCVCAECGNSYINPSALKMHMMRAHSGERPHMCTLCGMSFITSGNLKQHEVVHTGARPYACMQCDRRFTQISTLNSHVKRTHVTVVVNEHLSVNNVVKSLPFYLN